MGRVVWQDLCIVCVWVPVPVAAPHACVRVCVCEHGMRCSMHTVVYTVVHACPLAFAMRMWGVGVARLAALGESTLPATPPRVAMDITFMYDTLESRMHSTALHGMCACTAWHHWHVRLHGVAPAPRGGCAPHCACIGTPLAHQPPPPAITRRRHVCTHNPWQAAGHCTDSSTVVCAPPG